MPPSEIRKEARESLIGKWGKGACIILAYLLILLVLSYIQEIFEKQELLQSMISLGVAILEVPLSFGLIISFIKLKRGNEVSSFDFLKDGFDNFSRAWEIALHIFVKLIIPIIIALFLGIIVFIFVIFNYKFPILASVLLTIFFIACMVYTIVRSLLYVLSYYIAYDNPTMSSKECVLESERLMNGNRGNYFLLTLSFIGWSILATILCGIGYLWLLPYIQVSTVCFYARVIGKQPEEV